MTDKCPMFGDDWRARWLVLETWNRLHRVAEIAWSDEDECNGHGRTACGRSGYLQMPGVLSRLGLPRCAHCCRLTGTPRGDGCPENEK